MRKYGFDKFKFDILFETDDKEILKKKEMEFIAKYDSMLNSVGYNVSSGGFLRSDAGNLATSKKLKGRQLTKEHVEKISKSLRGHSVNQKTIDAVSETVKKIAGWNRGTKGIMKPNKTSFTNGSIAPNKGRKRVIDQFRKIKYVRVNNDI